MQKLAPHKQNQGNKRRSCPVSTGFNRMKDEPVVGISSSPNPSEQITFAIPLPQFDHCIRYSVMVSIKYPARYDDAIIVLLRINQFIIIPLGKIITILLWREAIGKKGSYCLRGGG